MVAEIWASVISPFVDQLVALIKFTFAIVDVDSCMINLISMFICALYS